MPFSADFDDIYQYGIKQTCKNVGYYCERVDEQFYEDTILSRIYNQIRTADLIVADMTGRNPNVFYETGYAHALGKTVLLLTQSAPDIPLDLKQYPHIVYNGKIETLSKELERRLQWYAEQPSRAHEQHSMVQVHNYGVPIEEGATIIATWDISFRDEPTANDDLQLQLDLHNPGTTTIDDVVGIDVVLEDVYKRGGPGSSTYRDFLRLPDGQVAFRARDITTIAPGDWISIVLELGERGRFSSIPSKAIVRIRYSWGSFDNPVTLTIEEPEYSGDVFAIDNNSKFSDFPIQLYNQGDPITDGGTIVANWHNDDLSVQIDFHNLHPDRDFTDGHIELIIPDDEVYNPSGLSGLYGAMRLPSGEVRFEEMVMFMKGEEWESETITIGDEDSVLHPPDSLILRARFGRFLWEAKVALEVRGTPDKEN